MFPPQAVENKEEVQVIWRGHSCFEIRSPQARVVLDPYREVPGYKTLDLEADLVLTSHEHDDHNARERVTLTGRVPDLQIEVIDSYHDDQEGRLRGANKIHILTLAGRRIAHLGDLGHPLTEDQAARLKDLDVMLIPVGGHYTIDAREAAQIVRDTRPDVTVPMHYRDGRAGWEVTSSVQAFTDLFKEVIHHDQPSFTIGQYHGCLLILKNPKK